MSSSTADASAYTILGTLRGSCSSWISASSSSGGSSAGSAGLFGVGLCGTVVGQLVVQAAIRRLKKESIITLLIAAVIGGSTLLMGANGVVEVIHSIRAGESQGFRPLCEEESPS